MYGLKDTFLIGIMFKTFNFSKNRHLTELNTNHHTMPTATVHQPQATKSDPPPQRSMGAAPEPLGQRRGTIWALLFFLPNYPYVVCDRFHEFKDVVPQHHHYVVERRY